MNLKKIFKKFEPLIFILIVWLLAFLVAEKFTAYAAVAYVVLLITLTMILLCQLFNLIFSWLLRKAQNKSGLLARRKQLLKMQEKANAHLRAVMRSLNKTFTYYHIYLILLYALLMLNILASAVCCLSVYGLILGSLSGAFSLICLYGITEMLTVGISTVLPEHELNPKLYPHLLRLIDEVKTEAAVTGDILVCAVPGSTINIFCYHKDYYMRLGVDAVSILTYDELRQILLHEMAYVVAGDVVLNEKFNRALTHCNHQPWVLGRLGSVLLFYVRSKLLFNWDVFRYSAARAREWEADLLVKQKGNSEIMVNALAKMRIFNLYMQEPNELFNPYHMGKPHEHFQTLLINNYQEMLNTRSSEWYQLLESEQPALLDAHATFPQRRSSLRVRQYSFSDEEKSSNYQLEQYRIINLADDIYRRQLAVDYEKKRHKNYLQPLQLLDYFENQKENGGKFDLEEVSDVALAYETIYEYTLAADIYDKIIEDFPENAWALLRRGAIYLQYYDQQGISLIYQALEQDNSYREEGLELIGRFCLKMGLKDELKKFRDTATRYYKKENFDNSNLCEQKLDNLLI